MRGAALTFKHAANGPGESEEIEKPVCQINMVCFKNAAKCKTAPRWWFLEGFETPHFDYMDHQNKNQHTVMFTLTWAERTGRRRPNGILRTKPHWRMRQLVASVLPGMLFNSRGGHHLGRCTLKTAQQMACGRGEKYFLLLAVGKSEVNDWIRPNCQRNDLCITVYLYPCQFTYQFQSIIKSHISWGFHLCSL